VICPRGNRIFRRCRFEPRYDYAPMGDVKLGPFEGPASTIEKIYKLIQRKTYVCDVCVRCGLIVERPKP